MDVLGLDTLDVARWQFGITTVYHFLKVPLTIGLGILVAVMHTGSVLAVGLLFFATQRVPAGERLEGWLRLASAAAVVTVGVVLLRKALRRQRSVVPATSGSEAAADHHGDHRQRLSSYNHLGATTSYPFLTLFLGGVQLPTPC